MADDGGFVVRLRDAVDALELTGSPVLLAVSGGADSVAMLRGLVELAEERKLALTAAHLNHRLRGTASEEDARWVNDLCRRLGVPIVARSRDVEKTAEEQGRGVEETARAVRYAFLQEAARESGCSHVATAHTADDQAETILFNVVRGTGMAGLAGMPPVRRMDEGLLLVRPLLDIRRAEVEAYLEEIGQEHREDETNLDERFTRNRIRRLLLPLLENEFNPQAAEALRRLGRQAADASEAMASIAAGILHEALVEQSTTICRLNVRGLHGQPRHLVRECLAQLWRQQGWPRRKMGFDDWDRLAALVLGDEDGSLTLPGSIEAARRGDRLMLRQRVPH